MAALLHEAQQKVIELPSAFQVTAGAYGPDQREEKAWLVYQLRRDFGSRPILLHSLCQQLCCAVRFSKSKHFLYAPARVRKKQNTHLVIRKSLLALLNIVHHDRLKQPEAALS